MAKPEFDPSKPFSPSKPAFDASAPFTAEGAAAEIGMPESFARGAAQGATFGFAPAISGAAQAIPAAVTGSSLKDILDAYNKGRERSKAEFEAAAKANPKTSFAGNIAGGLAPALLTGGVAAEGAAAKTLSGLAGGMIAPATAAGALTGAGYGALSGLGSGISSGDAASDVAKDVLAGGAGGAVLGGATSKLGQMLSGTPEALESIANKSAIKATGAPKSVFKQLINKDTGSEAYAASQGLESPESAIDKIGSLLRKPNEYTGKPVVGIGTLPEDVLNNARTLRVGAGKGMGDVAKQLDSLPIEQIADKMFNPANAAQEISSQLITPGMVDEAGVIAPVARNKMSAINDILDTLKSYGEQSIPFAKAMELKNLIKDSVNYETLNPSEADQMLKQAAGIINKQIDDSVSSVATSSGMGDLAAKYQRAKDLFGAASTAIKASESKVAGEMANSPVGLMDAVGAGVGAAVGGVPGAVLGAVANKVAKPYIPSTVAVGAGATSNALSAMNTMLVKAPKEAVVGWGQKLIQNGGPGSLETSLGNVLVKAGERDDIGRNALMFSLMQNEGYRKLLRQLMGQKEPKD